MKARVKSSDVTRKVWDVMSADARRLARERRGFIADLTEALQQRTGLKWHRQHIEMLLADDDSKRVEPRYGAGALLLAEASRLNVLKYQFH